MNGSRGLSRSSGLLLGFAADRLLGDPRRGHPVAAFGTVNPTRPECTIHVLRIATHYAPEWLGHEMVHCIHGRFHGAVK